MAFTIDSAKCLQRHLATYPKQGGRFTLQPPSLAQNCFTMLHGYMPSLQESRFGETIAIDAMSKQAILPIDCGKQEISGGNGGDSTCFFETNRQR